jgi:hypothetical protein
MSEVKLSGNVKRGTKDWSEDVRGRGLNPKQQAYIDSLPRVESKSAQNQEALAEITELNGMKASAGKMLDNEWMKRNEYQRKGKIMNHRQFLLKLRAAGVQCWFNSEPFNGLIGLRAIRKGYEQLKVQYICAVKLGWTTEFDLFHYDRYGVELNRKYVGWRSVLLQLVSKGILTERQAHKIFGKPELNEASTIYRRSLQQMRNESGLVA